MNAARLTRAFVIGVVTIAVLAIGSFAGSGTAQAQQLLGGLTGGQCSARGGQITTWTSTAGRGPSVGDCYIAPRAGGGSAGGFSGGGGGLGALGAGLQFLDALSNFVDSLPSNDAPAAQPVYDYKDTPEYREMERQQRALQSALSKETDDLQAFVRSGKPSAATTARADMCAGYADSKGDLTQCYRTAAAALEQEAAKCAAAGCRATMLRAAASARCVAGLAPGAPQVSATIATCGKDPASGLQRVAATGASPASATTPSKATGASQTQTASAARPAATAPANQASAQSAQAQQGAQRPRWIAPGSAAECAKLAQSSIARNTAGYYDLCVSDPPTKSAGAIKQRPPLQRTSAPTRPLNVQLPSPSDEHGCTWYGGSLRPDGSCWIIGLTTDDCTDLHGRVTESEGYKYCVIGGPAGEPARAAAPSSPSGSSPPGAPASDDALDRCRDGAAAPWTVAGCYDLLGQPAAQNRPGALAAKLRARLRRAADESAAERRREESAEQESAEEKAVQAALYRDWRADATKRYDRWVADKHEFVAENTAARDACTGRWVYDGTSAGSCDPGQARARWELAFEPRPSPSAAEEQRVADHGQPWRTNSETDCRNSGGIPLRPTTDNDITGLPAQLLDDPTVDQAALTRSFLCYQTLGRSN